MFGKDEDALNRVKSSQAGDVGTGVAGLGSCDLVLRNQG